jgi:hypothetical protein
MFRWLIPGGRVARRALVGGLIVVALLVTAKIHACACTGGPPRWHSVYPTSGP